MSTRHPNWRLWVGFGMVLAAVLTYVSLFLATRAVFWPCLVILIAGAALLVSGLRRAFGEPQTSGGRIVGPVLAALSLVIVTGFGFASYEVFKNFPSATKAPKVGQAAPHFTLVDSDGKDVSLTQLLTTQIPDPSGAAHAARGVLVVFYRGYW